VPFRPQGKTLNYKFLKTFHSCESWNPELVNEFCRLGKGTAVPNHIK